MSDSPFQRAACLLLAAGSAGLAALLAPAVITPVRVSFLRRPFSRATHRAWMRLRAA